MRGVIYGGLRRRYTCPRIALIASVLFISGLAVGYALGRF